MRLEGLKTPGAELAAQAQKADKVAGQIEVADK